MLILMTVTSSVYVSNMGTLHDDLAHSLLLKFLDDKEESTLPVALRSLMGDTHSEQYINAIGQDYRCDPHQWPIEQILMFARMNEMIMGGLISQFEINIGRVPHKDHMRKENSSTLSQIPRPFKAELDMTQRNGDQDGWLTWKNSITVTKSVGAAFFSSGFCHPAPIVRPIKIPAGQVPLEIGTTKPSRTVLHLIEERGVARWPYNSEIITVFISSRFPQRYTEIESP